MNRIDDGDGNGDGDGDRDDDDDDDEYRSVGMVMITCGKITAIRHRTMGTPLIVMPIT